MKHSKNLQKHRKKKHRKKSILKNTPHLKGEKEEKGSTEKHLKQKQKNSRCVEGGKKKKEKECISIYEN